MTLSQKKKKAPYNRSVTLSEKEIIEYKKKLFRPLEPLSEKQITNKLINGDIFPVADLLPDKFIDLLFIDPPYNMYKKFNQSSFNEMNEDEYIIWMHSWVSKIIRLLKPDASIYVCGDWRSSNAVYSVIKKYFIVQNRITWEREKGRGAKSNWKNCSEDIWFCTNSKEYTFNVEAVKIRRKVLAPYKNEKGLPKDWKPDSENGNKNYRETHPSNLWTDITVPFWSMPENTDHPTQKPEKLLAKIILASSNQGDFVFDPFLGSGTTAVAAKKLGRVFSGIEIDELYCCLAEKRLALAERDKNIQGYEDGVFWERNTLQEQKAKNLRSVNSDIKPDDEFSGLF